MSGAASVVAQLKATHPYVEATVEMESKDFYESTTVSFQLTGQDDIVHVFRTPNTMNSVQAGPPAFADQSDAALPWVVNWYNTMSLVETRNNTIFICHLRVMKKRCNCGCANHTYTNTIAFANGADTGYTVLLTSLDPRGHDPNA